MLCECRFVVVILALGCLQVRLSDAAEDGLARTPPMGWRSWNEFHGNINDEIVRKQAKAMSAKRNEKGEVSKEGISLYDLGYDDIGLDDNWQHCKAGINGSFHKADGTPIVNKDRFPNMTAMTDYIHSLGLKAGWYHNNCLCKETKNIWNGNDHYAGDAKATLQYGFDSVKLDGCGAFLNLSLWYNLLNAPKKKIMIENCHWGGEVPTLTHCPYHMYRTCGDISARWDSFRKNLMSTVKFQAPRRPLSRPGCWAYPDMLEVGRLPNFEEDRAHFGAWVITSSPLILGHDMANETTMKRIWPIISNKRLIEINQAWAGTPGALFMTKKGSGPGNRTDDIQIWLKLLKDDSVAMFTLNHNLHEEGKVESMSISVQELTDFVNSYKTSNTIGPWNNFETLTARCVYSGKDVTNVVYNKTEKTITVVVGGHDSSFLKLKPSSSLATLSYFGCEGCLNGPLE
mmetsp:Transcript_19333/g.31793  ORF Transcript_19333/g.31793 Transcript_19333/m.31793 type:complete len:457 (-) Transcript_19333:1017-2387(-)